MNNTFFQQRISRTGNLDSNLITRQNKLNLTADFMRIKYENQKLKQSEIANQLGYSSSTLQRYRNDIIKLSSYRIQSNKRTKRASKTYFNNDSHRELNFLRLQMISNDPKTSQTNTKSNRKIKNISKAVSIHENVEINDQYSDEILDNIDIQMDLAMQIICTDKTVRNENIQDLKEFNSQSLSTQAKKGEQLVSMMPNIIQKLLLYYVIT